MVQLKCELFWQTVCLQTLYTCVHPQCNVFRFGRCFEARKNWIYATRCGNLSFMFWYLLHKKYRGWCFADSMNEGSWINDRGATTLINHLQIYSLHQYVSCVPPKSNYFYRTRLAMENKCATFWQKFPSWGALWMPAHRLACFSGFEIFSFGFWHFPWSGSWQKLEKYWLRVNDWWANVVPLHNINTHRVLAQWILKPLQPISSTQYNFDMDYP